MLHWFGIHLSSIVPSVVAVDDDVDEVVAIAVCYSFVLCVIDSVPDRLDFKVKTSKTVFSHGKTWHTTISRNRKSWATSKYGFKMRLCNICNQASKIETNDLTKNEEPRERTGERERVHNFNLHSLHIHNNSICSRNGAHLPARPRIHNMISLFFVSRYFWH